MSNQIEGVPEGYEKNDRVKIPDLSVLNELFVYDKGAGKLFRKQVKSNRSKAGEEAGWLAPNGYRRVSVLGVEFSVHRLIYKMHTGFDPPRYLDHADGNKSNNKFENLRPCTHSENLANTARRKTNKSGFKGVHWDDVKKKWQATITHKWKTIYLGRYLTAEEAAEAYNKAAKRLFGEFAKVDGTPFGVEVTE